MPTEQAPPELLLLLLRGLHGPCAPHLHSLLAQLRTQHAKSGIMVSAYLAWAQRDAISSHEKGQQGKMTWARDAGVHVLIVGSPSKALMQSTARTWLNADGSHADAAKLQIREKLLCQDGPVPL